MKKSSMYLTFRKYWSILSVSWQNGLVYRMSVFMWRLRRFLATLMALAIWTTIYSNTGTHPVAFGYAKADMISYIFLIAILQNLVMASAIQGLAQDVYSGAISSQLLKPLSFTAYLIMQEIADKLKNVSAMVVEFIALFFIFKPTLVFPEPSTIGIFLLWALGAVILNFCITLLFGSLGFWSPETWGPRFLFHTLLGFTAGELFPLDVLPVVFQKIMYATPFPYLSFVQTQLFLGKYTPEESLYHTAILTIWIILAAVAAHLIWKKGLRSYEAAGQ